ncbi:MAG: DUF5615 family PIN-like protein [Pseudonocardiaceae bacterium]
MRFLVDANLSPRVAARLCDGGCEASHVQDHGLLNADDEKILHYALDTGHVIISADSDFATMLALNWYDLAIVDLAAFRRPPQPH